VCKILPITEWTAPRFNCDAFNVLNIQSYNSPNGTTGETTLRGHWRQFLLDAASNPVDAAPDIVNCNTQLQSSTGRILGRCTPL
jgi:hypothetical protein